MGTFVHASCQVDREVCRGRRNSCCVNVIVSGRHSGVIGTLAMIR